jgi:putative FmdB family regulatory protein
VPIYEYRSDAKSCPTCAAGFELMQPMDAPSSAACPRCGALCPRIVSAPSVAAGGAHRLNEKHLAKHGFTQYRKVGKGKYEKTAGKGPDRIDS